jgi:K+-sensing histidine kinase KdpD
MFTNIVLPESNLYQVNHELLFYLIYNLINNAIGYNKERGSLTVNDNCTRGHPYTLFIIDTR